MDWDSLIDEQAIAAVLPGDYAKFARPVCDGLALFLQGLPEQRQLAILSQQAALPSSADISQRLTLLATQCPVLHKLGQVLARDPNLAPQLRQQLQRLESLPPSCDIETIKTALEDELGPLAHRGIELEQAAIAEASVAVVVGYRQQVPGAEQGVLKILKPGIEQRMEEELALLDEVGAHLDQRCDDLGIPVMDYQDSFQQVREKLLWELRLDQEQLHLAQARQLYRDEPLVHIPKLHQHCTSRVTSMERLVGCKVTDQVASNGATTATIARLVVEGLLAKPVFSQRSPCLFHCDPHAGNLMVTREGRLGILDWSLVGELSEPERQSILEAVMAAATLNVHGVVQPIARIARQQVDIHLLLPVAQQWVAKIRQGYLPGMRWLTGFLDDAYKAAGLRLSPELLLFRKSLHTLDGVLGDLEAKHSLLDAVMMQKFLRQFIAEWPRRWFVSPASREFATRLSNLDLAMYSFEIPGAIFRYWLGQVDDLLANCRRTQSIG